MDHTQAKSTLVKQTISNQFSVLVVDDNPTNLSVIVEYLESENFITLVAQDGESGLKRAKYTRPDLILLDVLMPGINGFETCQHLKQDETTSPIPVIFMTALSTTEDKVKGFEAGAVDYIAKPVQREEMLARVKIHLKLQELSRNLEEKNHLLEKANQSLEQQVEDRTIQLTQALQTLQHKEAQSRGIFEAVSDGLAITDLETGMLLASNPTYCQLHGYSYDEILKLNPLKLIRPDRHEKFISFLATVKAQQQYICEANCRKSDGSPLYLEIKSVPFRYNDRPCALSIIRDVTERKQMELAIQEKNHRLETALKELQQAQIQIIQSEKMSSLGQLVAGVAHEINNPINFIYGNLSHVRNYAHDLLSFIQVFQAHYPEPVPQMQAKTKEIDLEFLQKDFYKTLESMRIGTDRIRQIVLSLRNFSRMDEAEFKATDLHEGIDSTLMILQHRLKASPEHSAIEVIQNYSSLPLVECYPGQLNQVFMNILANAIDALEESSAEQTFQENSDSSGRISIRTSVVNYDWVEIAIADNGPGIPEDVKERIFDPFFTTKPIGKGTGMGLSISYQIITEKHGGKLECFSKPNQGTEFVIQIPIQQKAT
ncbi:MAG: response regulator [Elainellaceae cyanobacterium]